MEYKMTKFEKELIQSAKFLSNDKYKVIAVYTECWKGLSVNSMFTFNKYLENLQLNPKRAVAFNGKEQVDMIVNYDLEFPVRVENSKSLKAIEDFIMSLNNLKL